MHFFLDRVFLSDLYKEGLALGWGFSLCKVNLSHTLSWLYFLLCQCQCPAVPPSLVPREQRPSHFFFHDFLTFSDASRPQESLPSNDCLDMHSLKLIV